MKIRTLIFGLAALCLLASCGKEEGSNVVLPDPMFGDITDPAWTVDSNYDYSSSMTAVVEVTLLRADSMPVSADVWSIDTADRLAAFVGDECIGLAPPDDGGRFFLFIHAPSQSYAQVSLQYYSRRLRNIFRTSTTFPFVNGSQQGTAAEPLLVQFRVDAQ